MLERFRRSPDPQTEDPAVATEDPAVATREPAATRDPALDGRDEREERSRFEREPAGGVLDREHARDDLGRDDPPREDAMRAEPARDGVTRDEAANAETVRDEPTRDDVAAFRDNPGTTRDVAGEPTMLQDREPERERVDERREYDDGLERHEPVLAPAALETMRARQRDSFGGIQWGSDFFGWLSAIGLASLLTAALVGAGVALGLSTDDASNSDTAQQIGIGGGIALLCVLAIAWFCGGYVAGRMARFDGARQGIGVWLWTILAAIVVAAVAAIGGSGYDIFERLNLPRLAVGDSTLNAGGAIAGAAAIVVTLVFAVIGGKMGERFHNRVDRVATADYVVERET